MRGETDGLDEGTAVRLALAPLGPDANGAAAALFPALGGGICSAAALIISSSSTFSAAHSTIHSTMSSLPSPNVCQTAFSSGDLPLIVTLVPPPPPEP